MKNLLETVIRTALFEARTVGIVKSVTQNELRAAQGNKTVWLYAVLTKRTSVPAEVVNIVYGATIANTSTDEGNRVAVGPGSKFSNGEFIYVVGNPAEIGDNDRRQLIPVSIVNRNNIEVTNAKMMVGKSPMLVQAEYDVLKAKNPTLPDTSGNNVQTTGQQIATVVATAAEKLGIAGKPNETPAAATTQKKPWEGQPSPQQAGYPYKWYNGQNSFNKGPETLWTGWQMVYTMSPTDEWVYWRLLDDPDKQWNAFKKSEFESTLWNKGWETAIDQSTSYRELGKKAAQIVEAKFGYGESDEGKYKTSAVPGSGKTNNDFSINQNQTQNQTQNQDQTADDVKDEIPTWPKVRLKTGTTTAYNWYKNDNKMVKAGELTIPKPSKVGANNVTVTDKKTVNNVKYYYTKIQGTGVWIKANNTEFKFESNKKTELKKGDTLKWTSEAVSGGVPTYRNGGSEATGNRITVKASDKITYISKNSAGTFYEIKHNGINIWVPKRYMTK